MQDGDDDVKSALLDFSYFLATNNMDEAFRSIKSIKKPAVWENMAHLCIKNKRLDVAEHCLGNMEHVRGAQAVREAKSIDDLDARVATVAVHLGMMDDARKLYAASERYDLLCRLYQVPAKCIDARVLEKRMHQLLFREAKHSWCFCFAFLLCITLQEVEKGDNKQLTTWWGRYCESHGDVKQALECYHRAKDVLSIVRVHCYTRNFEEAEEQVREEKNFEDGFPHVSVFPQVSRLPHCVLCNVYKYMLVAAAGADPAAAFYLARQYKPSASLQLVQQASAAKLMLALIMGWCRVGTCNQAHACASSRVVTDASHILEAVLTNVSNACVAAAGSDPAAAFHLARQYEAQNRIAEAIQYYTKVCHAVLTSRRPFSTKPRGKARSRIAEAIQYYTKVRGIRYYTKILKNAENGLKFINGNGEIPQKQITEAIQYCTQIPEKMRS
ncbi:hypothetical protein DUNSADRAFT_9438 [Dunaliella salina]|uniref:IF140/IFT172/WDR19 TPR domain-containing protein n=1 Tax=Dunaliella salina TaxID=3046 RepID=A0ABQ7GHJ3_DUNSA|nr:hypothetical protein DUNSADRAFT_9438 [Dunaliella salina]|eukprot:KAF5834047.1 hypothetical protein DUNSADRAFT_9438 [Dunaliella salina]